MKIFRLRMMILVGLLLASNSTIAGDKSITGVRPSSKDKLELLERPQADSAVVTSVPVSSVTFPIKVEEESGKFYLVRVGNQQGWVRASGVSEYRDAKVVCAEIGKGNGVAPITTTSTPGIGMGCGQ
jgi:hypothetical protein